MRHPLSAILIVKNEEANIARCLQSIDFADEVVIVDTGSSDRTPDICRSMGCRVYTVEWQGFGPAKQKALAKTRHDWILSIDADEEVSPELRREILETLESPRATAYRLCRVSRYLGRTIRFSGWQNDNPKRLFEQGSCSFNANIVHEAVICPGTAGQLKKNLRHYPYPTIAVHMAKIDLYTTLGARTLYLAGKRATPVRALAGGIGRFFKTYFFRLGFLDGREGLALALTAAWSVTLKYLKLWEAGRRDASTQRSNNTR